MVIRALPLVACLAPLIGIHLAFVLGVDAGVLPACNPYVDGCASISATGRHPPGSLLFRAVMLPQSVVLVLTWYFAALWLEALGTARRARRTIVWLGLTGAVALIVYVTFLGTHGAAYEFMRRFGIYLYFIGTVFAQVALSLAMPASRWRRLMRWTMVLPFLLGLANFAQKALLADPDRLENVIEWVVSLLMQLWFLWLYAAWRETRFEISVSAR